MRTNVTPGVKRKHPKKGERDRFLSVHLTAKTGTNNPTPFSASKVRIAKDSGYCAFPLVADTYHGCMVSCLYCFVPHCVGQHGVREGVIPHDPRTLFTSIYKDEEVAALAKRKIGIQFGVMSDPFPVQEEEFKVTRDFLKLLSEVGIGVIMSTKRPHAVTGEYIDLLRKTDSVVESSFSSFDDRHAKLLEPGATPASERIEALREIRKAGIHTVARLNPWLHTETYDYTKLKGAVDAAVFKVLIYSSMWRRGFPAKFFEVTVGGKAPAGKQNPGTNRYEWIMKKEKEYYSYYRDPEKKNVKWFHPTNQWIIFDGKRLREIFQKETSRVLEEAGVVSTGICCGADQGIPNIDCNSNPYCCYTGSKIPYDAGCLITQWHTNQWKSLLLPGFENRSTLDVARFFTANLPDNYPYPVRLEQGLTPFSNMYNVGMEVG